MFAFLRRHAAIVALTALAAALRLYTLINIGDFWYDELFSFTFSQKPWLASVGWWVLETNPPLHLFILKLLWYVAPPSEFTARLPSFVFGVALVPLLYYWIDRYFSRAAAVIAATVVTLSPNLIMLSAAARGYALLLLLAVLHLFLFYRIFVDTTLADRRHTRLFQAIALLGFFTHFTMWSVFFAEALALFLFRREKIKAFILYLALPTAAFLPWLIASFISKPKLAAFGAAWFFNIEPTLRALIISLHPIFMGLNISLALTIFVLVAFFVAALLFCLLPGERKKRTLSERTLVVAALAPIFLALLMGTWHIKFTGIAAPAVAALFGVLLARAFRSARYGLMVVSMLFLPGTLIFLRILPLYDWSTVNTYFTERYRSEKKQLIVSNNIPVEMELRYHLAAPITVRSFGYTTATTEFDQVTKNYLHQQMTMAEIKHTLEILPLRQTTDLFLFQEPVGLNLTAALREMGWQEIEAPFKPRFLTSPTIHHYVHK